MTSPSECSLLVLADERHFFDGKQYRCELTFDVFVNAIASHMRKTTIAVPTVRTGEPFGSPIDAPNLAFCELPPWTSLVSYMRLKGNHKRRIRTLARQLVAQHDAVLLRMPSLAAEVFAREARRQGKVIAPFVVANILTQANPLRSPNPLIRFLARVFARHIHRRTMKIVRHSHVPLAIGSELHGLCLRCNPASKLFMETLISERDLHERVDTLPADGPIILFRAARIEPVKGTDFLIHALALLVQRGYDVRLRLAGPAKSPAYLETLKQQARAEGVSERIEWLGLVPFGEPLYRHYREAHIGTMSSVGEGFPRFINEAWAFSLPVVTTRLPGLSPPVVPDESAVLVDLGSGEALADGIQRVIDDTALRRRIIAGGIKLLRQSTLERQSRQVAELIAEALQRLPGSGQR